MIGFVNVLDLDLAGGSCRIGAGARGIRAVLRSLKRISETPRIQWHWSVLQNKVATCPEMYVPERVIQSCSFAFGTLVVTITAGHLPAPYLPIYIRATHSFTSHGPAFRSPASGALVLSQTPDYRRSSQCIRAERPIIVSFSPKEYAAIAQLKHKSGQAPMFCVVC